jgi:hypothetical protein
MRDGLIPLVLVTTVMACQPGTDSGGVNDPTSPSAPSLGAEVSRSTVDFFFLNDFDRDISATVGLVSPVADLNDNPDCGGSGPRIVDGAIEQIVLTPPGSLHLSDRTGKATLVFYSGATNDVCELSSHTVLARGPVNYRVAVRVPDLSEPAVSIQFHMEGIVDLTSGGKARALSTANYFFDNDGNAHIRVDRLELTPIGN